MSWDSLEFPCFSIFFGGELLRCYCAVSRFLLPACLGTAMGIAGASGLNYANDVSTIFRKNRRFFD